MNYIDPIAKLSYLLLLLFIVQSCNGQSSVNKPETIFNSNIRIIEKYLDGETIKGTGLDDSITFMEKLSGIKSEKREGIVLLRTPTKENLRSWKGWYKKNKKRLYWDKNEQKVKLKE